MLVGEVVIQAMLFSDHILTVGVVAVLTLTLIDYIGESVISKPDGLLVPFLSHIP